MQPGLMETSPDLTTSDAIAPVAGVVIGMALDLLSPPEFIAILVAAVLAVAAVKLTSWRRAYRRRLRRAAESWAEMHQLSDAELRDLGRLAVASRGRSTSDGDGPLHPLHTAAQGGSLREVSALLACGLRISERDADGAMPLHLALSTRAPMDIVELLLTPETALGSTSEGQVTPLHVVASRGADDIHVVRKVVEAGGVVDARDATGATPLMIAACGGKEDLVHELLSHGADPTLVDDKKRGALAIAAHNGQLLVCTALLDAAEQRLRGRGTALIEWLNRTDRSGGTALYHAVTGTAKDTRSEDCTRIAEMLIERGASPAPPDSTETAPFRTGYEQLPLLSAVELGSSALTAALVGAGAPISHCNGFGVTPLHAACTKNDPELVELLLRDVERGTDETPALCRDNDGMTPLHYLVTGLRSPEDEWDPRGAGVRAVQIATMLLEHGAHADEQDYADCTPLHLLACHPERPAAGALTEYLLKAGATPLRPDCTGWTALHFAIKVGKGSSTSSTVTRLLWAHAEAQDAAALGALDLDAPRGSNELYHSRRGAHNRIPAELRDDVLQGNHTLVGFAQALQRMAARKRDHAAAAGGTQELKIVVLTGAGISTAAGIPDYRSRGGLYRGGAKEMLGDGKADETSATAAGGDSIFDAGTMSNNPAAFWKVAKQLFLPVVRGTRRPTRVHALIAALNRRGWLLRNFTQNVDGLESAAGIPDQRVVRAHGTAHEAQCISASCNRRLLAGTPEMERVWDAVEQDRAPVCEACGSGLRPSVVAFGEAIPSTFHAHASSDLGAADAVIVIGTSLVVFPFAGLLKQAAVLAPRLLINREPTGPWRGTPQGETAYRDAAFLGDCDEGAARLAAELGIELEGHS